MEDALRVADTGRYSLSQTVLILVLMEDALRESRLMRYNHMRVSLNPCSNGRCSASSKDMDKQARISEKS